MEKRQTCIFAVCLLMTMLAACGDKKTEVSDRQASEPNTYGVNIASLDNSSNSGYEIDDMLPRPSDDTFIMSLEDAEAFMNKKANKDADAETEEPNDTKERTSLIVYFSRADNMVFESDVDAVTSASVIRDELGHPVLDEADNPIGNMRLLAEYFSEETGADIFSIQTVVKYPTGSLDSTDLSAVEKNEDARPALSAHVENMDEYDVIYLGYPVCWETLPMPVASFLEEYDFAGKTIIPFVSHAGSGFGSGVSMIKELCPDSEVLDGFTIRDNNVNTDEARDKVKEFLAGL